VPGVAAGDAAQSKAATLENAVPLHGFERVLRTSRREPALATPPGAERKAVGANQCDDGLFHSADAARLIEHCLDFLDDRDLIVRLETHAKRYDDLKAGALRRMAAKSLAQYTLHAIAMHGGAHEPARKRNAESRHSGLAGSDMEHSVRASKLA